MAAYIIEVLKNPEMSAAIRNSFRHVGVIPFDREKIQQMIKVEQPRVNLLDTDLRLTVAVSLGSSEIARMEHLSGEKRKRDEEQKKMQKHAKPFVDNSFGIILTNAKIIAGLDAQTALTSIQKLSAVLL